MANYLLAIDQGTTSSRAILFGEQGDIVTIAQQEFTQFFPQDGWVEHDAQEIWSSTVSVCREAMTRSGVTASEIAAIGITNQRETTVIWDRATGEPITKAIVWQDRRTADYCESLRQQGREQDFTAATGLLLDPYFSGTKVRWILDNVPGARDRAARGELAFGTVDSFLLWRLSGGNVHKTDATNASRTLLYNIHEQGWDESLCQLLDVPLSLLPEVEDSAADFGVTDPTLFGDRIKVCGIAGDQQAALIGQGCFAPGMIKSTYGTGCFVLTNTGVQPLASANKLLTTVAYQLDGVTTYGLEGSIFIAGAAVQWLRDGMKIIPDAPATEAIANANPDAHGVYLVPAFTGLGAPYWDANARGAILGITRDTSLADVVTATLQSVCYQTRDLLEAMRNDGVDPGVLRVDGGMVANDWVAQALADLVKLPVDRPRITETTALGAAYLAGLQVGMFASPEDIAARWQLDRTFTPAMDSATSDGLYKGWQDAVARVRS